MSYIEAYVGVATPSSNPSGERVLRRDIGGGQLTFRSCPQHVHSAGHSAFASPRSVHRSRRFGGRRLTIVGGLSPIWSAHVAM